MERQFTATVYIFHENQVLLHFHQKHGKWLPPGGHLEPNETPEEAARREVFEETALQIEFLEDEHLKINGPNAASLVRPFLCLLEKIPPYKDQPAHEHIDFIFLAKPIEFVPRIEGFQWVKQEELGSLELFPDVTETLHYIYQRRCCLS